MNGMAGAGLACGIFGLLVAVLFGIPFVPFAVVAMIVGIFAVVFSFRGKVFARTIGQSSRISQAGVITGCLAIVIGVLAIIF